MKGKSNFHECRVIYHPPTYRKNADAVFDLLLGKHSTDLEKL